MRRNKSISTLNCVVLKESWNKTCSSYTKKSSQVTPLLQTHSCSSEVHSRSEGRELEGAFTDELLGTNRLMKAVYNTSARAKPGRAVITGISLQQQRWRREATPGRAAKWIIMDQEQRASLQKTELGTWHWEFFFSQISSNLFSLNPFSFLGFVSLKPLPTFLCCDWRKETKGAAKHFAVLKAQRSNILLPACVLCILNCPVPKHRGAFNSLVSHPQDKLIFHQRALLIFHHPGVDFTGLNSHSVNSGLNSV